MRYSATIDVPDLAAGIAFYSEVLGLTETARPIPVYAILAGDGQSLGIMEKAEGTRPTPVEGTERRYTRHWTPVHLDFHVDDFDAAIAAVERLGGTVEQRHTAAGRPPIAFCADPFGNGLCILGPR
jgi:predicted enzyme related to lactoylglutathione lyase